MFPGGGSQPQVPTWHTNHTLPKHGLLATIHLRTRLPQSVKSDSIGVITLRHHTSSIDAAVLTMQQEPKWLWVYVDFDQIGSAISPLLPGPYAITLQLSNPHLQVQISL